MSDIFAGSEDALVVVDLQNDFCPGGALAVPEGDLILPQVNILLAHPHLFKVATRDWHPTSHMSFKAQGGIWPPHCVANTLGAQFPSKMYSSRVNLLISKGTREDAEAYSGFDGTPLASELKSRGIRRIFVCGLATDYCVCATALDARQEGTEVVILEDTIRAVDVRPGDGGRAIQRMRDAGCVFARSVDVVE